MTDPRRLLEDDGSLSEAERQALVAARGMAPPSSLVEGSWAELLSKIGGPPGSGGPDGSSGHGPGAGGAAAGGAMAKAAGVAGLAGKAGLLGVVQAGSIGAVLGALVTTALVVLPSREPRAPVPAQAVASPVNPATTVVVSTPANAAATPAPADDVAPLPALPVGAAAPSGGRVAKAGTVARAVEEPSDVAPASAPAAPVNSTASFDAVHATGAASSVGALRAENVPSVEQLRAEARLVGKAREALRGGNAALAIRQLDDARQLYPGGGVRQEREALAIEALLRLGRTAEASRRARDFERDFPGSPFAARVKSLTAGHSAP